MATTIATRKFGKAALLLEVGITDETGDIQSRTIVSRQSRH